jgi:SAM-dependent methyltransferase
MCPQDTAGTFARKRLVTHEGGHYWNRVAEVWNVTQPQPLWRKHSDIVNQQLLARWLPTGRVRRLLKTDAFDEAYSSGLYAFLTARAAQVIDIDIATSVLAAAKTRCPCLPAVGADVRCLPFADGTFDVVVSNSTLDHFATPEDIVRSLRELRRVLRDGGQLIVTLDNLANPVIALRSLLPYRLLHSLGLVPYYVGVSCAPARLRQLVQEAGFDVVTTHAILHCPRVLAVPVMRLLEKHAPLWLQQRFLAILLACERLAAWPTRFFTGHFIAVNATARPMVNPLASV